MIPETSASVRSSIADPVPAPGPGEIAGMACIVLLLLGLSVSQSIHRIFWSDEIMGMLTLTQPSISSLLHFWREGIDSSGIFFYVFARPWIAVFGPTELAMRLFSASGIALSAMLLWRALRRFYPPLPIFASIAATYLANFQLRWQLSNARTYGVLMASLAWLLYLLVRGEEVQERRPGTRFLACTALAYAIATGSHILGPLYAVFFLGAQFALDFRTRRFRPTLYAVAAVAILAVLFFSLQNIHSTAMLGKPSFWTQPPTYRLLLLNTVTFGKHVTALLLLLILSTAWFFRVRRSRMPIYVLAGCFVLLDLGLFFLSRHATSIYVDRYLLPFTFAAVMIAAELLTQIREAIGPTPRLRAIAAPIFFVLLSLYKVPPRVLDWRPYTDYTGGLLASLPSGLPVIDTDVDSFVEVEYYHRSDMHRAFFFPTDNEVALDPRNRSGVSGFHEMDNFHRLNIDAGNIVPTNNTLAVGGNDFLVLIADVLPSQWFQRRILESGHYVVLDRGAVPGKLHLWEVRTH